MKNSLFKFLVLVIMSLCALSACAKQEEKRIFDEVLITAPRPQFAMANPHAAVGLPSSGDLANNPHAAVGLPSPEEMAKNPHAAVGLPSPEEMAKMPNAMPGMQNTSMDMANLPMGAAEKPNLKIKWDLPVDWVSRESSGMRLATLTTGSDQNYAECTIISLSGQAGGLESNIRRWMGQVAIKEPSVAEFQQFLSKLEKFKTRDGSPATFIDLTRLQTGQADSNPSILVTVVDFKDLAVFVKMSGSKATLTKNLEKFRLFCKSLDIRE